MIGTIFLLMGSDFGSKDLIDTETANGYEDISLYILCDYVFDGLNLDQRGYFHARPQRHICGQGEFC